MKELVANKTMSERVTKKAATKTPYTSEVKIDSFTTVVGCGGPVGPEGPVAEDAF